MFLLLLSFAFLDQVWMSHGDQLSALPNDFHVIGHTNSAPYAAIAHNSKPCYGIQFHPEVTHSPRGREVIRRFILDICQCRPNWTMACSLLFAPARTGPDSLAFYVIPYVLDRLGRVHWKRDHAN